MRSFLCKTLFFWKIFWELRDSSKLQRPLDYPAPCEKKDKQNFSPPAMGSENLGRGGGMVALANVMQQSSCTALFQGRGKGCKPEWAQLLAFFFSQNVFDDAAPGPSVPALTPECPESTEWCKILDFSYSEQKGLMMRGCRSVGRDGDGYMESLCSSHTFPAGPLMGQVVMILSRTKGHTKPLKVLKRLLECLLLFQAGGVQLQCYFPFPLKLCLHDTMVVLDHALDLRVQDLSSSVKFFPGLDLEEKFSKIWDWGSFCCYSAHLSQILFHSYLRTLQTKEIKGQIKWVKF